MFRLKQRFSGVGARFIHTPVAKCYDGQSVFITGATGFLGKVLLEKLLYSCPGINNVYLLIRENQESDVHQRIKKILDQPLFSRLKNDYPHAIQKIVPVAGNISKPQLGIKDEDIQILQDKVSIVFHSAATVKFDEPLDVSTNVNVNGTQRVLNLCHSMKHIKALVHVSTAFINKNSDGLDEKLYDSLISVTKLQEMIDAGVSEDQLQKLLDGRPNTYTFTKAMAESLVAEQHGNIPTAIIRPSATGDLRAFLLGDNNEEINNNSLLTVTCSKSEPIVGWLDNWFIVNAFLMMIGNGWLRCLLSKPEHVMDIIPVEYVANLMIVAAVRCDGKKGVEVFNCTSSRENPLTTQVFINSIIQHSSKHKYYDFPPHVYITSSKTIWNLITLIFETLPVNVADLYLTVKGKKPRYKKIQNKMNQVRGVLEYFFKDNWSLPAPRTRALAKSLSPNDRKTFPFDPRSFNWEEYLPIYCESVRKYLLKK